MPQATAAQLAAIDAVVGLLNLSGEALSSSETALAPYEPPTSWDELSDSSHAPPRKVQRLVLVYIDPEHAPPREGLWRLLPDPPATPMAPTPGFKPTPATPRPCPASPVVAACSPGAAPSDEAQDLLAALAAPPLPPARNAVLNNTRAKAKAKAKSKGKAGGGEGSKAASAATSAATMATADKTDGVIAATVAQVDVGVDARVRACLEEMHGKGAGAKAIRAGTVFCGASTFPSQMITSPRHGRPNLPARFNLAPEIICFSLIGGRSHLRSPQTFVGAPRHAHPFGAVAHVRPAARQTF